MAGFNHFPQIAVALRKELSQAVTDVVSTIALDAASMAPVDTGYLRNSIYYTTFTGSTYLGGPLDLPEVDAPPDALTAYVAVGAYYGVYLELGTRYQPPQPYFFLAVEEGKATFEERLNLIPGVLARVV